MKLAIRFFESMNKFLSVVYRLKRPPEFTLTYLYLLFKRCISPLPSWHKVIANATNVHGLDARPTVSLLWVLVSSLRISRIKVADSRSWACADRSNCEETPSVKHL